MSEQTLKFGDIVVNKKRISCIETINCFKLSRQRQNSCI